MLLLLLLLLFVVVVVAHQRARKGKQKQLLKRPLNWRNIVNFIYW
jgi:hypothetical protein